MEDFQKLMEMMSRNEKMVKVNRFRQLNKLAAKGQIVFAGSSLAEHFPIDELMKSEWANGQGIEQNGRLVYNRGIGGDTTADLMANLDACIFDLEPSKIFINIGSNDIGSPGYDEDTLVANVASILNQIKERLPEAHVYQLSYYPVNPDAATNMPEEFRKQMFATRTNEAINSANDRMSDLAASLGYGFIDVSGVLKDAEGKLRSEFTVEGVHLWPDAYVKVLEVLRLYF